ncbi:sensor protein EvgS precursor [bacterium BMS3Abin04]|nr:sensor protein EvgS precursor [bacterium BMS3Abin04]
MLLEGNLTFIVVVSIAFLFFIGILTFLIKKNIFESQSSEPAEEKTPAKNEVNSTKANNLLEELKLENSQLRSKLAFLEVKLDKTNEKMEELKTHNSELQAKTDQLNESKKKLEDLQEQKDELLSIIVHDIKNPASAIRNFIELLESYDLNAQEQQEIMSGLLETSTHILALADEVSKIMNIEKTSFKLYLSLNNINKAVDIIAKRNQPIAQKKSIKLSVTEDESIPEISMDFNKIVEVIDNFVNNAIKFAPEGIRIEIITKIENNNVVVKVADTGYGLSETDVQKAFEKGTKLSTKPTGGESSSGLGLWITKKIIEAHKGRVWVKSHKGSGSTFAFQIPIVD